MQNWYKQKGALQKGANEGEFIWKTYHSNGQLKQTGKVRIRKIDKWESYDRNGNLIKTHNYSEGDGND